MKDKDPEPRRVIVSPGATSGTAEAHHQDFPEIRAHGENPGDAASRLANQLVRALDSALTHWRRDAIQSAINDVESYINASPDDV